MIITIFGATGMVGKRLVRVALANGHHVRAFGRNVQKLIDADLHNDQLDAIHGYVFDAREVREAIQGADAVISVLGGSFDGLDKTRSLGIKNIIEQMQQTGVSRIVALGNLAVLDDGKGNYFVDAADFPPEYLPVGREHLQAYLFLKTSQLDWTYVCAPDIHDQDATGQYLTNAELPAKAGKQSITAGDLADFMLQECLDQKYMHQRVGISN